MAITSGPEVYKILQGISQAMARAHDGARGHDGERVKIGLKREVDNYEVETRQMDGFGIKLLQNQLIINYSAELTMRELHDPKWEDEIESRIEDIAKFLKKEYRRFMGNALSLKRVGECRILVQDINRHRQQVNASCKYEIGGLPSGKEQAKDTNREELDKSVKDFLSLGKGGQ